MKRLSEKDIETYIRFPEKLSLKKIKEIEGILAEDEELLLLADWFESFYEKLDEENISTDKSPAPATLTLTSMNDEKRYKSRRFILAAKSESPQINHEHVKTFQSLEHKTLMRILKRKSDNTYYLHVISDFIEDEDVILLKMEKDATFKISKPGGKLILDESELRDLDLEESNLCELLLPLMSCKLSQESSSRDGYVISRAGSDLNTVEISFTGNEVKIVADPDTLSAEPHKLLISTNTGSSIWNVDRGVAILPQKEVRGKDLNLFFYN